MLRKFTLGVFMVLFAVALFAANKEQNRLENCGVVMQEIVNVPDNIPQELLEKADCVIVFPSVIKAAFVVGGSYGRGAMVCRSGKEFKGPWGAPAMYALEGGSVGFQIGGEATDLILLVMNQRGADSILSSKVKLGADASAAAGPKGRDASADTDAYMRSEILSYSRSRGLFAGISLEGSTLRPDDDASADVYGRKLTAREIVTGGNTRTPASGRHLVAVLEKNAPRNESKESARSR
ncbi:MAG: lipid-binding SYLF domain-containing protein [Candidatus Acidiferrales bacterium]